MYRIVRFVSPETAAQLLNNVMKAVLPCPNADAAAKKGGDGGEQVSGTQPKENDSSLRS